MSFIFESMIAALGIGGAAAAGSAAAAGGAAAAGAGAGAAAAGGISLAQILQGGATVIGIISTLQAGQAEAAKLELEAQDAERERPLETLQGIDRRRSLKAAAAQAIGDIDVANAASGVDLSFGTAAQARSDALRELDLGLTSESGTTMTRLARLTERAGNYRQMAKRARSAAGLKALGSALSFGAGVKARG